MNKYFLVDESGENYLFKSIEEICCFLGADCINVIVAMESGALLQGYTADELM